VVRSHSVKSSVWMRKKLSIKVIGNQWYWMYEQSKGFNFFNYHSLRVTGSESLNFYEDEIIFSYLSSDDDAVSELLTRPHGKLLSSHKGFEEAHSLDKRWFGFVDS